MAGDAGSIATALARTGGASQLEITARPQAALGVVEGQAIAARVLGASRGEVELAIAGGRVRATTSLPLEAGQTLRLVVASAGPDGVVLRPDTPASGRAQSGAGGLSPAVANALAGSLPPGTDQATGARLAADARALGIATPGGAAAFARLASAGLPTGPSAVTGMAQLVEGAPLGRALATLLQSLPAMERGGAGTAVAAQQAAATSSAPREGGPPGAAGQVASQAAIARAGTGAQALTGTQAPAPAPGTTAAADVGAGSLARAATASQSPSATIAQIAPAAQTAASPAAAGAPLANPGLAELVRELVATVAARAVTGDGDQLARAAAELGRGLEARLRDDAGRVDVPPLRAALLALAQDPETSPALARQAGALADAIAAQGLAGALPRGGEGAGEAQPGAYLQIPLPGGDTVEVMVNPDAQDEDPLAPSSRKLAFLLHLSELGPVMVEAVVGDNGAEAVVRAHDADAGTYLATRTGELADGLRESGLTDSARVRVERGSRQVPERLLEPPPAGGVDLVA